MTDTLVHNVVNQLRNSIEKFNAETSNQTKWMLRLTWVIAALTLLMTFAVGVQIWLALRAA